jgi:hypothetical protein
MTPEQIAAAAPPLSEHQKAALRTILRGVDVAARFWAKVDRSAGPDRCWPWLAYRSSNGYGRIDVGGRIDYAHRIAYELTHGDIPAGLHIDHLCRVRECVNPGHLEPVTALENTRRGMAPTTIAARDGRCRRGHEFTPENTLRNGTKRRCRECRNAGLRARRTSPAAA